MHEHHLSNLLHFHLERNHIEAAIRGRKMDCFARMSIKRAHKRGKASDSSFCSSRSLHCIGVFCLRCQNKTETTMNGPRLASEFSFILAQALTSLRLQTSPSNAFVSIRFTANNICSFVCSAQRSFLIPNSCTCRSHIFFNFASLCFSDADREKHLLLGNKVGV